MILGCLISTYWNIPSTVIDQKLYIPDNLCENLAFVCLTLYMCVFLRSYALQTPGIKSIWDLGLDLFRRRLEERIEVGSHTNQSHL
jgi:hypothetical protein